MSVWFFLCVFVHVILHFTSSFLIGVIWRSGYKFNLPGSVLKIICEMRANKAGDNRYSAAFLGQWRIQSLLTGKYVKGPWEGVFDDEGRKRGGGPNKQSSKKKKPTNFGITKTIINQTCACHF
jgi:hypothetical protein